MNHQKTFFIVCFLRDGATKKDDPICEQAETFISLAVVNQFTPSSALKIAFGQLAAVGQYKKTPLTKREHDMLYVNARETYTVCLDIITEEEYKQYLVKIESGELSENSEMLKKYEENDLNSKPTLIVCHSWDDNPNNGVDDFSQYDMAFMLSLDYTKVITSIYEIPTLLDIDISYLRYKPEQTQRFLTSKGNQALKCFCYQNKYERWYFQYEETLINLETSEECVNFGYVSVERAREIIDEWRKRKEERREENHKTEAYRAALDRFLRIGIDGDS